MSRLLSLPSKPNLFIRILWLLLILACHGKTSQYGSEQLDVALARFLTRLPSLVTTVALSTNKLLGRIVAPNLTVKEKSSADDIAYQLHSQTYGLASDALAGTAILFSALIHDG